MALHREGAFSKPGFAKHGVSHESVFEEIPLVVRSSNLSKVLLTELEAEVRCLHGVLARGTLGHPWRPCGGTSFSLSVSLSLVNVCVC
jgi:hypothetical protein